MKYVSSLYGFSLCLIGFFSNVRSMEIDTENGSPLFDQQSITFLRPYFPAHKELTQEKLEKDLPDICRKLSDKDYMKLLLHAYKTGNNLQDRLLYHSNPTQQMVRAATLTQCGYDGFTLTNGWRMANAKGFSELPNDLKKALADVSKGGYNQKPFDPMFIYNAIDNNHVHAAFALLFVDKPAILALNNKKKGGTPLHCAARKKDISMLRLLIEEGFDIEAKNYLGNTSLHNAVTQQNVEGVRYLLKKGANPNAKNACDCTPWSVANKIDVPHIVELFVKIAADRGIFLEGEKTLVPEIMNT